MSQSAAMPLTAITAYEALFERLGVALDERSEGQIILIIGGACGVGSMAIQLAKQSNLLVVPTASRAESESWCRRMGADAVITHSQAMLPQLQELRYPTVNYILNTSHTKQHWTAMAEAITPQGHMCGIVDGHGVDLSALKRKTATFSWEFMFTRSLYRTEVMIEQHRLRTRLARWADAGKIQSTPTESLSPLNAANLRKAYTKIESGRMIGKFILTGWYA